MSVIAIVRHRPHADAPAPAASSGTGYLLISSSPAPVFVLCMPVQGTILIGQPLHSCAVAALAGTGCAPATPHRCARDNQNLPGQSQSLAPTGNPPDGMFKIPQFSVGRATGEPEYAQQRPRVTYCSGNNGGANRVVFKWPGPDRQSRGEKTDDAAAPAGDIARQHPKIGVSAFAWPCRRMRPASWISACGRRLGNLPSQNPDHGNFDGGETPTPQRGAPVHRAPPALGGIAGACSAGSGAPCRLSESSNCRSIMARKCG